jgi:transcriptional regulator with XRE-family HTH domain
MKDISKKIRTFRLANRMTLKELAKKAGCTATYLSQLEKGQANPSIMILKNIAAALDVKIGDFFTEQDPEESDVILKEEDRVSLRFEKGDTKIQMLVRNVHNKLMQPFINIIEPGGGSHGSYSHMGEEFGIVLQGFIEIHLDGEIHRVKRNQSFYFSSGKTHGWVNPGKRKAVVIWVTSPPTF